MSASGLIRPYQSVLGSLQRVFDVLAITGLYLAVVDWRLTGWTDKDTICVLVTLIVFQACASANNLYHSWRIDSIVRESLSIFMAWSATLTIIILAGASLGILQSYWKLGMVAWLVLAPLGIAAWRLLFRIVSREARRRGHNTRAAAIAGVTPIASEITSYIEQAPWTGLRVLGFYDDRDPHGDRIPDDELHRVIGDLDLLVEKCMEGAIDVVFITLPFRAELRIRSIVSRLSNTTASVYFVEDFSTFDLLHGRTMHLGGIPMVSLHETPFYGVDGGLKRFEDIVLGSVISLMIFVPCLIIAALVKLTSPGPAIYKQERYGLNGKPITVWKFRTMQEGADKDGAFHANRNDPRTTRFGSFLRKTSLDELPQFFNVLTGTMSIVGPRPHAVVHNERYRSLLDSYMLRHKVKPGITGWAQVNGWRGEIIELSDMESRIKFDLEYIRNWSLALDLKIIMLTIVKGFTGEKAY